MRKMADGAPGASFVEVPEAGHLPSIEPPKAFDQAVASFPEQARSH